MKFREIPLYGYVLIIGTSILSLLGIWDGINTKRLENKERSELVKQIETKLDKDRDGFPDWGELNKFCEEYNISYREWMGYPNYQLTIEQMRDYVARN